jgi:anti-sigma B factor antagonist
MFVREFAEEGVTIVEVSGRLDNTTAPALVDRLQTIVTNQAIVIIDLGTLEYISSSGLRVLLLAAKQAQATHHAFVLAGLLPSVKHVFDVTGFSDFCTVFSDRKAALASLADTAGDL